MPFLKFMKRPKPNFTLIPRVIPKLLGQKKVKIYR